VNNLTHMTSLDISLTFADPSVGSQTHRPITHPPLDASQRGYPIHRSNHGPRQGSHQTDGEGEGPQKGVLRTLLSNDISGFYPANDRASSRGLCGRLYGLGMCNRDWSSR